MLSLDDVLVYTIVYVVKCFVTALRLVKNYLQLGTPLLKPLDFTLLRKYLPSIFELL